ncbi:MULTISPECIES: DNA-binding domain-containing protein [Vibrio]|uniref:HvfC/BufC N-terminal domain-containing protein n=1 Tax=Vibrio TaxID=662 RepID=UPI001A90949D|nr:MULTISPECIES: DNA-binding domain-containing protein [Vibrio]MBO0211115.1 putative DNA-binding domain-containing protein [Vibrio sp. Vb0877]WAE56500.1 DNA-binding domain-containing protein [Vibrio alginolyticus]
MNLATLQNQFAKALHYQALGEDCDIASDKFTADERMQIYRNNFIVSLSEVLSATYPMVEALLGEECFEQISRQHVLSYPLEEGNVVHYGEGFQDTIMQFSQVIAQAPYSPEVARFEWHIDLARQAQYEQSNAAELKPLALLGEVSEEQQPTLILHLKKGCRSFDSNYAVFDLFSAIQTGQFEQLNINQLQQGVISIQANGEALCHALDADVFQLLQCLEQKQSLSEIPEVLLAHLNRIMALDIVDGFTLQSI